MKSTLRLAIILAPLFSNLNASWYAAAGMRRFEWRNAPPSLAGCQSQNPVVGRNDDYSAGIQYGESSVAQCGDCFWFSEEAHGSAGFPIAIRLPSETNCVTIIETEVCQPEA